MFPFTLKQLQILKAVTTEKNLTKAAETLYLSQPSLSKQLKNLEIKLNLNLTLRENNKIYLTEIGKILLRYSERVLELCKESCRVLSDFKKGNRGHLTIGASQTVGTYLIPQILVLFAQKHPQIDLQVQVNLTKIITKNVINKNIDIAVVGGKIPDKFKNHIKIEHFVKDEFNLIISNSHPFTKKKYINKNDLYHLNFITLNPNSTIQKFTDNILLQNHIQIKQLKITMQLNSIESIKTAVSLGLGAAFVSSSVIKKEIEVQKVSIIKIKNIKIIRILSILSNLEYYNSKTFRFFYNELRNLKNITTNN